MASQSNPEATRRCGTSQRRSPNATPDNAVGVRVDQDNWDLSASQSAQPFSLGVVKALLLVVLGVVAKRLLESTFEEKTAQMTEVDNLHFIKCSL